MIQNSQEKHQFFVLKIFLSQTSQEKETYVATKNILQKFEEHGHWHCRHTFFGVVYNFSKIAK